MTINENQVVFITWGPFNSAQVYTILISYLIWNLKTATVYALRNKDKRIKFRYICSNFLGLPCNLIAGKPILWEVFAAGPSSNMTNISKNDSIRSANEYDMTAAEKVKSAKGVNKSRRSFKILHLTDIHHDPHYEEGSLANCPGYLCCRSNYGRPTKKEDAAGKWGDYRNCDAPGILIEFVLDHIKDHHKVLEFCCQSTI